MSISRITNPLAIPLSNKDYKNQNLLLKKFMYKDDIRFTFDKAAGVFTIKAGSFFIYNHKMHEVDEDIVFPALHGTQSNYARLSFQNTFSFDGNNRRFHYNEDKKGYYIGSRKFFDIAYVKEGANDIVRLKTCELEQIHLRLPNTVHPKFLYIGQWVDVSSSYASLFFRVKGTTTLPYDGGTQEAAFRRHGHRYNFNEIKGAKKHAIQTTASRYRYKLGRTLPKTLTTGDTGALGDYGSETRPVNKSIQVFLCGDTHTQVV